MDFQALLYNLFFLFCTTFILPYIIHAKFNKHANTWNAPIYCIKFTELRGGCTVLYVCFTLGTLSWFCCKSCSIEKIISVA